MIAHTPCDWLVVMILCDCSFILFLNFTLSFFSFTVTAIMFLICVDVSLVCVCTEDLCVYVYMGHLLCVSIYAGNIMCECVPIHQTYYVFFYAIDLLYVCVCA